MSFNGFELSRIANAKKGNKGNKETRQLKCPNPKSSQIFLKETMSRMTKQNTLITHCYISIFCGDLNFMTFNPTGTSASSGVLGVPMFRGKKPAKQRQLPHQFSVVKYILNLLEINTWEPHIFRNRWLIGIPRLGYGDLIPFNQE